MRRPLRSDEARSIANVAIDLGDPGRMSKARRMHRSNSVGTVDISPGVAHASVTDADGEIYEVEISVVAPPATGVLPSAGDLLTSCTCDDTGDTCMHALAAVLGIAEEVEANGRVLELWTRSSPPEPVTDYQRPTSDSESFFTGAWKAGIERPSMTPLRVGQQPVLVVEDVDAGPVVVDARAAITDGLSRYRARPSQR